MAFFRDFLTVSRAKILTATLPHAALGIALASGPAGFGSVEAITYIVLYFVLIIFACNINCFYDVGVDSKYKKDLAGATKRLGKKRMRILMLSELVLAVVLIGFLIFKQKYVSSILSILGLVFGIIYSAPPLRIKARGFLSPFPVLIGLYTLPVLGGWFLQRTNFPLHFALFVLGYALLNEGFTLVNTCEDKKEDEQEGIKTWAHVFGIRNTLYFAVGFSTIGSILCVLSLLISHGPWAAVPLFFLVLVLKEMFEIFNKKDLEAQAKKYAKKMPKWFFITRYPLLLAALA